MPFRKFKTEVKKKKYRYWMKCADEHLVGETDDPRRTLTSIWKVYRFCKKSACVDFGKGKKSDELCITEDDNRDLTYVYKNEKITKHKFKQLLDEH